MTKHAPPSAKKSARNSSLAGIQYAGEPGCTQECLDAVIRLIQCRAAQAQAEAQASVAAVKRVPLMLPAPVIDPLASEIAALAESLKARSAAACEFVPAAPSARGGECLTPVAAGEREV